MRKSKTLAAMLYPSGFVAVRPVPRTLTGPPSALCSTARTWAKITAMRRVLQAIFAVGLSLPAAAYDPSREGFMPPPFKFDKTLPSRESPVTIEVPIDVIRPLKFSEWADVPDLPRFHCDGAVITRLQVTKFGSVGKTGRIGLRVRIGLRRGFDRAMRMRFDFLNDGTVVGWGEMKEQNLDEGENSSFETSAKLPKAAYEAILSPTVKPTLRLTLFIDE